MQTYLQPQDDGLPARDSHPHVVEKLHYLKRYIDMFETSMHKKWPRRTYVDLFAGPGKCRVGATGCFYLGSPLLALTTRYPFSDYFFVDKDAANIETLEKRCRDSPSFDNTRFIAKDSNLAVYQIVEQIKELDARRAPGSWSSLNLAFLDPEGFELRWTTVAALASIPKMDLIIYYPEMGLTRNLEQFIEANVETPADLFFGDFDWRTVYKRHISAGMAFVHHQLIGHYQRKLESIGYVEVREISQMGFTPQIRNTKGAPLYRLLFASKHPLGNSFWKKVMSVNAYGQLSLYQGPITDV